MPKRPGLPAGMFPVNAEMVHKLIQEGTFSFSDFTYGFSRPMPARVTTQSPTHERSMTDVLSRIRPIELKDKGVTMALYGKSGTGKTRFAATWPKPLLLIGAEDGTRSIRGDKGIDFVKLTASEEMRDIIDYLQQTSKYKSVELDTGTMLQDIILMEVCGLSEIPVQKGWGIATLQQYGQISLQTKKYMQELINLKEKNINVCIICQEKNYTEGQDNEVLQANIGSALMGKVVEWLHPAVENVCQMFIRNEYTDRQTTAQGKTYTQRVKTGKYEFCLRTGLHDNYASKVRVPRGQERPDVIVDPDWEKFWSLINGKYKA